MKKTANTEAIPFGKTGDARLDVVKCILSLFVVAIHTDLFPLVLFPWLRMAVPLFFVMTGYFLFRKLSTQTDEAARRKTVAGFVRRNAALYAFWFLCLCPLILYIRKDLIFQDSLPQSILALVKLILFGSTFTGSWYIMAGITGVLIITVLLRKVPTKALFFGASALFVILALTSSYGAFVEKIPVLSSLVAIYTGAIGQPSLTFPIAVVWLACGKCFAENCFPLKKRTYIIICVASAVLLYGEWQLVWHLTGVYKNDCYLFLLPFCFGLFGWLQSMEPVQIPDSIHFRRCSTVIYTMHGAVNRLDGAFYRRVLHIDSPLLCFVTTCIVCAAAYAVIAALLRRTRNPIIRLLRYAY